MFEYVCVCAFARLQVVYFCHILIICFSSAEVFHSLPESIIKLASAGGMADDPFMPNLSTNSATLSAAACR
jgi:hypothetical protein